MQQNQGNISRKRTSRKFRFKKSGRNKRSPDLYRNNENMVGIEGSIKFYKDVFDMDVKDVVKKLEIPKCVDEKISEPIVMFGGEKFLREALKKSADIFGVSYTSLGHSDCGLCDKCGNSLIRSIVWNARGDSEEPYAVLVEDSKDPSMQYANMQLCEIEEQGLQTMTLAERLVFGLWFHWKHGKHADWLKSTLCSGTYVEHEEEGNEKNLNASFVVYFHKELRSVMIRHVNGEEREKNRAPRLVIA